MTTFMKWQTPSNISTTLPRAAREALLEAASVDPGVPPGESEERAQALALATSGIHRNYPNYFRPEVARPIA